MHLLELKAEMRTNLISLASPRSWRMDCPKWLNGEIQLGQKCFPVRKTQTLHKARGKRTDRFYFTMAAEGASIFGKLYAARGSSAGSIGNPSGRGVNLGRGSSRGRAAGSTNTGGRGGWKRVGAAGSWEGRPAATGNFGGEVPNGSESWRGSSARGRGRGQQQQVRHASMTWVRPGLSGATNGGPPANGKLLPHDSLKLQI
ncbi:hypothetical protein DFS34DRAFT_143672 [Phlyctochytrium arcticum]|nr:hypothetical protein DFS34DRAFT_143672 [Phlyctochytrium arcticum]